MIVAKDNLPTLTPKQYLAWEAEQPDKYELIDGHIYAMTGGSVNHGRIAIRLTALFDAHLEESHCITGNSDIKVNIAETQNYTYPDASVTCDDRDKSSTQYITYPCLIVEVLSKSTEAYDRGSIAVATCKGAEASQNAAPVLALTDQSCLKRAGQNYRFRMYRQNPMLVDYLLVSSTSIEIDLYHKNEAGDWLIINYQAGDTVELKSINLHFPIAQIYRGLTLTPEPESVAHKQLPRPSR